MNDNRQSPFSDQHITHDIGDRAISLDSRSLRLGGPTVGAVWNRPIAARLGGPGGETRLPIHDRTRRAQLTLYAISLLFIIAGLAIGRRRP